MTYSDRLALPDDYPFVAALHDAPHARGFLPGIPTHERYLATLGDPTREQRVIVDALGRAVGFWLLILHEGWLGELRRVIAAAPGRGIGMYAVRRARTRAFADLGAHRLWLEVTADNTAARRLYEREGFCLEGTFRDGYRGADWVFKDLCAYGMLAGDRTPIVPGPSESAC